MSFEQGLIDALQHVRDCELYLESSRAGDSGERAVTIRMTDDDRFAVGLLHNGERLYEITSSSILVGLVLMRGATDLRRLYGEEFERALLFGFPRESTLEGILEKGE